MVRRLLSIGVVLAACVAAVVLTAASGDTEPGKKYKIVFDNVFGLVEGGEMKIGNVTAGKITGFELTEGEPKKVAAKVEVTEPGFDSLRKDAECGVRQQSLIGEYFIDCQFGKGARLPDGGTVPVQQTSSTIPIDLVNNVMRRPYRERSRLIIAELGTGLAGRPDELNEVIRRAHPALRELSETFNILARQNRIISDFIKDADTVSAAVEPKKFDVSRWAKEASETAAIQASRQRSIAAQWRRLPRFLDELRPTLAQLNSTASEQIPLLRRLQTAAPHLERFFTELGPFARASRGSTRALGEASVVGRAALRESLDEIQELRALSPDAPKLAKPLRQLLQTIDDRKRGIDDDPEAGRTAPPPPDKTAFKKGQGFTGMEAFWNYIYWQTLGTNSFDDVGHLLRIGLISNSCSPYHAKPTQDQIDRCNAWLGPEQPGVNRPDPTEGAGGASAARSRDRDAERSSKRENRARDRLRERIRRAARERGGRGGEALPRELRDLLGLPNVPGLPDLPTRRRPPRGAELDSLLDFLFGP